MPSELPYDFCFLLAKDPHHELEICLNRLQHRFATIFSKGLRHCPTFKANITLKSNSVPTFLKSYNIPYALKDEVREKIQRLVFTNVLKPINYSECASPIVVVRKSDGTIRISADFKSTVNPQTDTDRYPIARIEDIFYNLQGGQYFTKIYHSEAYLQPELSDSSEKNQLDYTSMRECHLEFLVQQRFFRNLWRKLSRELKAVLFIWTT